MRSRRLIVTADTHTQGEPTRLVIGGVIHFPGATMRDKQAFASSKLDGIRKSLMGEPRGHGDMFGGFITPPATDDGDVGIIFMDNSGYLDMCGHGTIGLCTALAELGMVQLVEPRTEIRIDTPVGRVLGYADVENGSVVRAGFHGVASFCLATDEIVELESVGAIRVGIAYGGNFFAIARAADVGIDISLNRLSEIRHMGMKIKEAANGQLDVRHPFLPEVSGINIVTLVGPPSRGDITYRNVHIFSNGQVDRSPGGTGTSAVLAYMIRRGDTDGAQGVVVEGLAGGLFEGAVVKTWEENGITYHTPDISGKAYLTGIHCFYLDPTDPMGEGFMP